MYRIEMRRWVESGGALLVAVSALAFAQVGCSLLFLKEAPKSGEPPAKDRDVPLCTERSALPVLDSVAAAAGTGVVLGSLVIPTTDHDQTRNDRIGHGVLLGGAALVGVLSGISAAWGFVHMSRCRKYLHPPGAEEKPLGEPALEERPEEAHPPDRNPSGLSARPRARPADPTVAAPQSPQPP